MTEPELQNLLNRAVLRMRTESALKSGLAAAVCSLGVAALAVFIMRGFALEVVKIEWLSSLPPVAALICGSISFLLNKPSLEEAATILDRRANTREHLTTWVYLRTQPAAANSLHASFKKAQDQSTLKAAETVQLKRDMPVRFPGWSRAFWLALILFISAVLTPAADPAIPRAAEHAPSLQSADGNSQAGTPGAVQDALMNSVREIPRVQVLSPAQMRKLELIATDPRLPQSMQADALKELQNAIGGIPESELTNDVRQLLETLRQLNAGKSETKTAGNVPGTSPEAADKTKISASQPAAEYKAFESVEKGWSSNEPRFADVKDALSRYYKSAKH